MVDRYDLGLDGDRPYLHSEGDWVEYEDYEKLDERNAELEAGAKHYNEVAIKTGARIAKLETFVEAFDEYISMEGYSWQFGRARKMSMARKALEEGNE